MPRRRPLNCLLRWTLPGFGGLVLGCGEPSAPSRPPAPAVAPAVAPATDACPAGGIAPPQLPRTRPEHETLGYWLARTAEFADLDRPVLGAAEVRALNGASQRSRALGFAARADLRAPIDVVALAGGLQARVGFLRERFGGGKLVQLDGSPLPPELQARYAVEITPTELAADMRAPLLAPGQGAADWFGSPARSGRRSSARRGRLARRSSARRGRLARRSSTRRGRLAGSRARQVQAKERPSGRARVRGVRASRRRRCTPAARS